MELKWDETGKRLYETGVSNGALYVMEDTGKYKPGVAWNGLTGVTETPSGAEATSKYADNMEYLTLRSAEKLKVTIKAFTYPEEFAECDGTASLAPGVSIGQQPRRKFAFAFKTLVGDDIKGNDHGYKLHIIYGCSVAPSERPYATVNDTPEAMEFSWEAETSKVSVPGNQPTSIVTIDSTLAGDKMKVIEEKLFGSANGEPTVIMPEEIAKLMEGSAPKHSGSADHA